MWGVWLGLAGLAIGGCGGECNGICEDYVVLQATIEAPVASLDQSNVVYCRNGACSLPTPRVDNGSIESRGLCATVAVGDLLTSTTVTVAVDLENRDCPITLADGDRYRVTISDADGQVVADEAGVATYQHHTSCGTSCEFVILALAPL